MEKPTPPGEYDCCESGCEPCIWDSYYVELANWNDWRRKEQERKASASATEQPDSQA